MANFTGFVGPSYQAPSIYQDCQETINWSPEVDPTKSADARGVVGLYPTPGLLEKIGLPAGEVQCLYVLPGGLQMIAVCGGNVYVVESDLTFAVVGAIIATSGRVYVSDNRVSAMVVDGINRYSYNITSRAFAVISAADGAFQGGGMLDYLDTFLIYSKPSSNVWGATSPLTTASPALSFSSKDSSSDNIVGIIADHREVVVIGERTTERWINVGAFPFPFQRIPGTSMQHGCAARDTICRLGESVAWLAADARGQAVFIQMNGYSPRRFSTHAIENEIAQGVISDATAFTYQQNGHEYYHVTFPTQDKTFVYDLTTELWHKRAYRDDLNVLHRHRANCCAEFQGMTLVGDYENGKIYALDLDTYTDAGQPIIRIRRTPHLTESLNRVFHESLQIQFQPGVGLVSGQGSDPQIMVRWSDDGGSTWSQYYFIAIGKIGEFKNRAIKRKLGWGRDRVYEVSITDPVKAVILSAELVTTTGDS